MVVEVLKNLFSFIVLFILFLMIFSILTRCVMINENLGSLYNEDDGGSSRLTGFLDIFLNTLLLSMGMGINDEIGFGLFLFIVICISFIIVLLNLLIAVVGDTFEKVQEKQVAYQYIEHCSMMLDVE